MAILVPGIVDDPRRWGAATTRDRGRSAAETGPRAELAQPGVAWPESGRILESQNIVWLRPRLAMDPGSIFVRRPDVVAPSPVASETPAPPGPWPGPVELPTWPLPGEPPMPPLPGDWMLPLYPPIIEPGFTIPGWEIPGLTLPAPPWWGMIPPQFIPGSFSAEISGGPPEWLPLVSSSLGALSLFKQLWDWYWQTQGQALGPAPPPTLPDWAEGLDWHLGLETELDPGFVAWAERAGVPTASISTPPAWAEGLPVSLGVDTTLEPGVTLGVDTTLGPSVGIPTVPATLPEIPPWSLETELTPPWAGEPSWASGLDWRLGVDTTLEPGVSGLLGMEPLGVDPQALLLDLGGTPGDAVAMSGATGSLGNMLGALGPALSAASGIYGLSQGQVNPSTASSALAGVAGLAGQAGALLGAPTLAAVGAIALPIAAMGAIVTLASLVDQWLKGDRPSWPAGFSSIPGQPNAAVNPETGMILWYQGNGQYVWAPQTLEGRPATPEQLLEWGAMPGPALILADPRYADVAAELVRRRYGLTVSPEVARQVAAQLAREVLASPDPSYDAWIRRVNAAVEAAMAPLRQAVEQQQAQGPGPVQYIEGVGTVQVEPVGTVSVVPPSPINPPVPPPLTMTGYWVWQEPSEPGDVGRWIWQERYGFAGI